MSEEWKPVVGFEGVYEVSNLGRVRSLDRVYYQTSRGGCFHPHKRKGQLLRPGLTSVGYPSVVLGRKRGTFLVHRLVAEAFIGPCPEGCEVRHKDGTRNNNTADNIEYGTRKENMADARRHGTLIQGHDSHRKVPREEHDKIRSLYARGLRQADLEKMYDVTNALIHRILRCGLC